jgi:hypothetical protein
MTEIVVAVAHNQVRHSGAPRSRAPESIEPQVLTEKWIPGSTPRLVRNDNTT